MVRFDCKGFLADPSGSTGQLDAAAAHFIREGYVVLDHVLTQQEVEALRRVFLSNHASFLRDTRSGPSLKVGERRYMIGLRFAGPFADPRIFANPAVIALVYRLLEATAIIEAYGCFVSLPGAEKQHEHHDGPHLFEQHLSALLPPYALTFAMPLVEMNEAQGSTVLLPGSHRWQERPRRPTEILPIIPQGSCMLWDYRLLHHGTENRSEIPRPLLYCTYARPWYRDPVNFRETPTMPRLDLPPGFVETLPEDIRGLLLHATALPPGNRRA